jgi:hypothetical protein
VPVHRLADKTLGAARLDQVHLDRRDTLDLAQRVDRERPPPPEPLVRERAHDGQFDPLGSAGDDRDLSRQLKIRRTRLPQSDPCSIRFTIGSAHSPYERICAAARSTSYSVLQKPISPFS